MKKTFLRLLTLFLLIWTTTIASYGQNSQTLNSLSILPEADTLVYINAQRIINEALPRLMPEKDLAQLRQGMASVKQMAGVDPAKVEYVVLAVRFRKPTAELNFIPPEFMVLSGGDFSADSLMVLARMASGGKLRDEVYGSKTLGLFTIEPIAKEAEKNPILKSLSEVAVVPLNATTIAVGTPSYLKAAVDAGSGQGRISTENLNSLLRDPNALISISGRPLTAFNKSFGLLGTEVSSRQSRCETSFGDFYLGVTMDATNFMLRGALNADNPDTAKIVHNLFGGLLAQAISRVPDKRAQEALKSFSITPQNDEIVLRADVPQQTVLNFIKEQMAPKKEQPVTATKPAATTQPAKKPAVRTRRRPSRQ